ncbi:MAG: hypothetical protein MJ252_12545 [archaeon]|nr:hypothetical protein [archaeon]
MSNVEEKATYEELMPEEDHNKFRTSINDDMNSKDPEAYPESKENKEEDSAEEEEDEEEENNVGEANGRPSAAAQIAKEGRASRAGQLNPVSRVSRTHPIGKKHEVTDEEVNEIFPDEMQDIKNSEEYHSPLGFCECIKDLSIIAFPSAAYNFSTIVVELINLAFLGQRYDDPNIIDAIGISNLLMNCTTFYVFNALMAGIENLCSNALALRHYKLMGYYYQRARIIAYAYTIFISIFHIFTLGYTLPLLADNDQIFEFAHTYCYFELGQAIVGVQGAASIKMLEVFEMGNACIVIIFITSCLHPLWCYIFVFKFDWDVKGTGLALVITMLLNSILTTGYLWWKYPHPKGNFTINKKCFNCKGLCNYMKFTAGAAFLEWAELFCYEVMSMFALFMGDTEYSVYVILMQMIDLLFSIPLGFVQAMTILIADYIAAKSTRIVKNFCILAIAYASVCEILVLGVFYIFSKRLMKTFTTEDELIDMAVRVIPFLCMNQFLDNSQSCMMAIFKGLGKQYMASAFMLLTMYGFQPLAGFIGGILLKGGVYGLFLGNSCSLISCNVLYFCVLMCIDFEYAQEDTVKRIIKDRLIVGERESHLKEDEDEEVKKGKKGLLPESYPEKKKEKDEEGKNLKEGLRKLSDDLGNNMVEGERNAVKPSDLADAYEEINNLKKENEDLKTKIKEDNERNENKIKELENNLSEKERIIEEYKEKEEKLISEKNELEAKLNEIQSQGM